MGESNNSVFENVLLKIIDEDAPINVDLLDRPPKSSVSAMRISTISKTEKYIDKNYAELVKSELKKEIFLELQHRFLVQKKGNEHFEEFMESFKDQILTLKIEINFQKE